MSQETSSSSSLTDEQKYQIASYHKLHAQMGRELFLNLYNAIVKRKENDRKLVDTLHCELKEYLAKEETLKKTYKVFVGGCETES